MFRYVGMVGHATVAVFLMSALFLGQQTPTPTGCAMGCEFPVRLRQSVAAGKTPPGTTIEGKLIVATLVNGTVIPRDAILSGEVIESTAKSTNAPSRLSVRLKSAQWKNGSVPLNVYLTAWFYPEEAGMAPQDLSYQPPDAANSKRNWNGMGAYPDPNNPVSQEKFPGRNSDKDSTTPPSPSSNIAKHRVLMKNVDTSRASDAIVLLSSHGNIKLDKFTAYVFAPDDLLPKK